MGIQGNPVHAGRLHRHVRDATGREPGGEPMEVVGKGRKGLDRHGIAIRGHRDEVLSGPAVDPCGVGVEPFEGGRRLPRLGGTSTSLALHGGLLLYTDNTSGNRDADERQSPQRDHAA